VLLAIPERGVDTSSVAKFAPWVFLFPPIVNNAGLMESIIHTVGHSNRALDDFLELLEQGSINLIADVRSHPYSGFAPHFSQGPLEDSLRKRGMSYVFLGKELGARSDNPACYEQGRVSYAKLAVEPSFRQGIGRLIDLSAKCAVAIMCAERDPIECHRGILIAKELSRSGLKVRHVIQKGTVELQKELENRLLGKLKLPNGDMFTTRAEFIDDAYRIQSLKIAYVKLDEFDNEVAEAYK
ncbi:MAG: DUF488 domain-containing protein, partial [Planctomycetes bacterium]|nr:DUF488 domain-containing protein [Planctomycetota bacterium]